MLGYAAGAADERGGEAADNATRPHARPAWFFREGRHGQQSGPYVVQPKRSKPGVQQSRDQPDLAPAVRSSSS